MRHVIGLIVCAGLATSAMAGTVRSSGNVSLFGNSYGATTWEIKFDSGSAQPAPIFGAESMTFFNGTLYVGHDHNLGRGEGQLVTYTPGATGDLSAPVRIFMGNGPAGLWGPEGMTVNDSGSGYGSFAPGSSARIVGVDTNGTDSFGVFNTGAPGSGAATPINAVPGLDDIAWVGSIDAFAALEDGAGDSSFLRFYDKNTMIATPTSVPVINGAKGLVTVSAAFATLLTGLPVTTPQAFIAVSEFENLAVYDTNGLQIGSTQSLTPYLLSSNEPESVAVDEARGLLFIGDEAGTAIHVLAIPTPGAAVVLGMGALVAARRRRA